MNKGLRNVAGAIVIAALAPLAQAAGGPVVAYTDRGEAIGDCLKVLNVVEFAPGVTDGWPVILRGSGKDPVYIEGTARIDLLRGIATVEVNRAIHADGHAFKGHFVKLAYRANESATLPRLVPSDECAVNQQDVNNVRQH